MTNIKDQLTNFGWSIKMDFFDGNKLKFDEIKKQLLDTDLKQIGEKSLPETAKLEQTTKPYVVQLYKTRNVAAPKDNETSTNRPHLYRLMITDGHVFQNALILPSLKNFNLDTPPGVKILLKPQTKFLNGFYILNDQTCEILGGNVHELVHKWKLNKLMGKHVRTLIGEGAPPPWVPFGTKNSSGTKVDTSQRSMDVAKMQQTNEEDPEFVRQRRAAIDTLLTDELSKNQRFATQNVMKGSNVAKCFQQANQRMPVERPNTASSTLSVSNKPINSTGAGGGTAAAIKANTRLPDWAKSQIADEALEDENKRQQQFDRKQNFGRNRRGRGRGDDDGGEETRPSKDVTLFDFLETKPKTQKSVPKSIQNTSNSKQPTISTSVQKQIFPYENGDQVLARYFEDNEYYPAVVLNVMFDSHKCAVMFEGYDNQEIVNFDDIEPYEEGYYYNEEEGEEEEDYSQEQIPPVTTQRNNSAVQYQQRQQWDNQNRNRPNSTRGYQQQQQYPNRYNNNPYN